MVAEDIAEHGFGQFQSRDLLAVVVECFIRCEKLDFRESSDVSKVKGLGVTGNDRQRSLHAPRVFSAVSCSLVSPSGANATDCMSSPPECDYHHNQFVLSAPVFTHGTIDRIEGASYEFSSCHVSAVAGFAVRGA